MSDEVSLFKWVMGGAISVIGTLTGVVWADNKRRLADVERLLANKADAKDVDKIEDTQGQIFSLMRKMSDDIHAGQTTVLQKMGDMHADLLQQIAGKQDRQ